MNSQRDYLSSPWEYLYFAFHGGCTTWRCRLWACRRAILWAAFLRCEKADIEWPWADPRPLAVMKGHIEQVTAAFIELGRAAQQAADRVSAACRIVAP